MQRRSFFSRLAGAAAVTAVAVEAKSAPVSNHSTNPDPTSQGTVGVQSYGAWQCSHCGSCMMNFHNKTLRCTACECPNYDKPLRAPVFQAEAVDDEEEIIRHALILLGVMIPGESVPKSDLKLCSEVVRRIVKDVNDHNTNSWPYTAKDIRPWDLAGALHPYYKFGTE